MSGSINSGPRPLAAVPVSRRSWFTRNRIVALAVLGSGVLGVFAWAIFAPKAQKEEVTKLPVHATNLIYDPPPVVHATVFPPAPAPIVQSFVPPPPVAPAPTPPTFPVAAKPTPPPRPAVYVFGGGTRQVPEYMKPPPPEAGRSPSPELTGIAFKPTTIPGAKTMTIPDPTFMLLPGPFLCVLTTAVNTDIAGPFQCVLPKDVLSSTNVTLMEKGTRITGNYASSVSQGQTRIVAVAAQAITPNNVVVPLGSGPMADEIGAGGVPGNVDNHWMERLGGALTLSLVDSAFSLAQTELQKSGSTNLNISSGGGVSTLASQLLAKTINIPPTITLPQGTTVALWNTGIIDFTPSYILEMAR